jgi:hypothetical protein
MANTNSSETGTNEIKDDNQQWGQAILRAKTALIKPYSKVKKIKFRKLISFIFNLLVHWRRSSSTNTQ